MSWVQRIGALILMGLLATTGLEVETPVGAQTHNELIYDDQLHWENWSWGTDVQTDATSPVFQGNHSMGVTYNQAAAGLSLRDPGLDTSPFTHLQFALHADGGPFPTINVSLYDAEGSVIRQVQVQPPYATATDVGWQVVTIPLEDLDGANMTITRVQLQNASGGAQPEFFVDKLGFIAEDGAPAGDGGELSFTVTTTEPGDDAEPGDGRCEDDQGECTLQGAVQEANALDASVTIHLLPGTYVPDSLMSPGLQEDCGPQDLCYRLVIQEDRTVHLVGAGETQTIIDGNDIPVIWVSEGATVEIEGVTIQGGQGEFFGTGGGISNEGTLTLHDSVVAGNSDLANNGGIGNRGSATLWNVLVENNRTGVGGTGFGGGIGNHGTMTIESSMVRENFANISGGGVWNTGSLAIQDASIIDNSGGPAGGGGVRNDGELEVLRLLVSGNTTSGRGGGFSSTSGSTRIVDSTITHNEAGSGGGISGSATLEGTAVIDNIAEENGGGIFVGEGVRLRNSDVINNTPNDCSDPVQEADEASSDSDGTCIPENDDG